MRTGERRQGVGIQAAIVKHLAEVKMQHAAVGLELRGPRKPFGSLRDVAPTFFGEPELGQRCDVLGVAGDERFEFARRRVVLTE